MHAARTKKEAVYLLDEIYMRTALALAHGVMAQTAPNPPVGAVVVKKGKVIGLGAHLQAGEAHAEVIALEMAEHKAEGATLYTTLEPCSHTGKTPPCADLIIKEKLQRVVIACQDPHEKVAGEGIQRLEAAGIEVKVGVLESEAANLYQAYFQSVRSALPYVTAKVAMSLDGKMSTSTGESKWITDESARADGHFYRHTHDAILVGIETVLADYPLLTTRLREGKQPVRVILDTHLRTPEDAPVITNEETATWIFTGSHVRKEQAARYEQYPNVKVWTMPEPEVNVRDVMEVLMENGVRSVLVEGGGKVQDSFLQANLIHQLIVYMAPMIIGGEKAGTSFSGKGISKLADAMQLEIDQTEMIGKQIKIVAKRKDGI